MMQKLMIIGAGIGQVPLLKKAQNRGIHTTVVSPDGNYPCLKMADAVFYKDIYDREAIVEYARKEAITAVTSDQNDLMMPTVAYVAETLHLPGNRLEQVLGYCNKSFFRKNCREVGIPVPKSCTVSGLEIPENMKKKPFPWIVKPEDSQSSIGITKVESAEELYPAIQLALSKSRNDRAIVEEFFSGHEIVCEGFIYHGRYYLLAFADRKYFHLDGKMIPCQTVFPSQVHERLLQRIVNYEKSMAEKVNPSFAIVHAEYLINLETEEIRCVESALRGGGVYISSHLIPAATGIDINGLLLDCVLGTEKNVDTTLSHHENKSSAYICFSLPDGIIENVQGIKALNDLSYIPLMKLDNLVVGNPCRKLTFKGDRHGPILVTADNISQLNERIEHIKNTLHVSVRTLDGTQGEIFWE